MTREDTIESRFEPIAVSDTGKAAILETRRMFQKLAAYVTEYAQGSRETSLFLTHLEESSHWAIRAISITHEDW